MAEAIVYERYRTLPDYVEAFQWQPGMRPPDSDAVTQYFESRNHKRAWSGSVLSVDPGKGEPLLIIVHRGRPYGARPGDFVVRNADGQLWVVAAEQLLRHYERV